MPPMTIVNRASTMSSTQARYPTPACFDSTAQWVAWAQLCLSTHQGKPSAQYCYDCLPDYQAMMRTEGRCKYPDTTFSAMGPEGGIHGIRKRRRVPGGDAQ